MRMIDIYHPSWGGVLGSVCVVCGPKGPVCICTLPSRERIPETSPNYNTYKAHRHELMGQDGSENSFDMGQTPLPGCLYQHGHLPSRQLICNPVSEIWMPLLGKFCTDMGLQRCLTGKIATFFFDKGNILIPRWYQLHPASATT
jgi:hypothetical protein